MRLHQLRRYRELAGYSQMALADRAGLARMSVVRIEAGHDARPATAKRLADALRVRIADLVGQAPLPFGAPSQTETARAGRPDDV